MKKRVVNDLQVVLERRPLRDRTNISETKKTKAKVSRKQKVAIDQNLNKNVPYSEQSQLNRNENAKVNLRDNSRDVLVPNNTMTTNGDIVKKRKHINIKDDYVSTKRIIKKTSRCPCCCESSISKNVTTKDNRISGNKKVENKTCHVDRKRDLKFNLQCRVLLERVNIQELLKKSQQIVETKGFSKVPKTGQVQELQDQPVSVNRKVNVSAPIKSLRQQEKLNYAEQTLDSSVEETIPNTKQICATKVPVYKQNIVDQKFKKSSNLYEFDESDIDQGKEQGKRRHAKDHEQDMSYSVSQKHKAKKGKAIKKNKVSKVKAPARKYNDIMKEVIQKVMGKINQEPKNVIDGKTDTEKYVKPSTVSISKNKPRNTKKGIDTFKSNTQQINLPKNKNYRSCKITLSEVQKSIQNIDAITQPPQRISTVDISNALVDISSHMNIQNGLEIQITLNPEIDAETKPRKVLGTKMSKNTIASRENVLQSNVTANIKECRQLSMIDDVIEQNKENRCPQQKSLPSNLHTSQDIVDESFNDADNVSESKHKENVPMKSNTSLMNLSSVGNIIDKSFSDTLNANDIVPETNNKNVPPQQSTSPASLHPAEDIIDESFNNDGDDNGNASESDDSLDESFLEFVNIHSTPISKSKINIISDIVLHEKDNQQQTTHDAKRGNLKHNPWRFNQAVRRNPHFIVLKTTALPCLKQDMVLDHNQVEKIEEHFSKTPKRIETPKKSPVQKSILKYVSSPVHHEQENVPCSSLFDYDDFSPIKAKSPQRNKLKDKAKRNILAPIHDNAGNIGPFTSTPAKGHTSPMRPFIRHEEDEDIANCFGFNDENDTVSKDKGKLSEAKPFRIKQRAAKKQAKPVVEIEEVEENLPAEELNESPADNVTGNIQLFDDPEQGFSITVPSKIYERKRRRKRLKSMEVENDEELHSKKKKKDVMTKAEEAAMEDWAAKFNSMCREIEKYDLEIE